MEKMYIRKAALALGVAALASTSAMAEGYWSNINNQIKNPAFIAGWSGALTAADGNVAETWDGCFEIYQVVNDAPAGEYTLTANACYRYGTNDYAKANMSGEANHHAYIFLGAQKKAVKGLFDDGKTSVEAGAEFDATKNAPNSMAEANAAFAAGQYVNTMTINHAGGDLRLGIAVSEYRQDQWCIFDNFKLVGPNGEVALVNADFASGIENSSDETKWDMTNVENKVKTVDINKEGGANGCYRKTNASPYNFGQYVELPAGKYRWGVQSFFRYGNGNQSGWYVTLKGFNIVEGESAYDKHVAGTEDETLKPMLYVVEDDIKPISDDDIALAAADGKFTKTGYVKCIFDETLDVYPDNEPKTETVAEGQHGYADSGYEHEAAAVMVKNPNLYRNYVEFELDATKKLWLGYKKDVNAPTHYWNPFRDFTLEKWVEDAGVDAVVYDADENAPVEYFNLQGVRVANPENGIFIVKQGNKVSKAVIK